MRREIIPFAFTWAAAIAPPAQSELVVRSPLVEYGEVEFEHNGLVALGRKPNVEPQSHTFALSYGATTFWNIELEVETGALPGRNLAYEASVLENIFQLVPEGRSPFNLGFFAAYARTRRTFSDTAAAGPIVQMPLDDVLGVDSLNTLNVFLTREVGRNHGNDTGLFYGGQSVLMLHPLFHPGLEAYGTIGSVTRPGRYSNQAHSVGPVVTGGYAAEGWGSLRYEIGYQLGLTSPAARQAVRWRLEYALPF